MDPNPCCSRINYNCSIVTCGQGYENCQGFHCILYQFHLNNNNNNTLLNTDGVCAVCYATSHGDHRAFLDRLWNCHGGWLPRSDFYLSQFSSSFPWISVLCSIKSCSVSGYHQHFITTFPSP